MFTIRQAELNDIDNIIHYRIKLLFEAGNKPIDDNQEILVERLKAYFNDNLGTKFFCWIAEHNNEVIAISGLNLFEKPPTFSNISGLEGYIMNMYVKEEFRGKGIATSIMNHIVEYLKEIGVDKVKLLATEQGRPVYKNFGFTEYSNGMELNLRR